MNEVKREFKLSNEALGSLMMALQKSLLEQSDIVPVLQGFKFRASENFELFIMNPPIVKFEDGDSYTESED